MASKHKTRDIVKKAENDLLQERIRLINKLGGLENQKVQITFESSKWGQVNKLNRLRAKMPPYDDNNIDLKKWVVNISKYKLN